jgi:hypothetical protein
MKRLVMAAAVVAMVGLARAEDKTVVEVAKSIHPGMRAGFLTQLGVDTKVITKSVSDEVAYAALFDGWKESVVVDAAMKVRWSGPIAAIAGSVKLSAESIEKVKAVLTPDQAERSQYHTKLLSALPFADRAAYPARLQVWADTVMPANHPIAKALYIKYTLLQGNSVAAATNWELLNLVLSSEFPSVLAVDHTTLKNNIKARAILLAKRQLRKEGKTFVAKTVDVGGKKTVVNPLDDLVKPVVDALNAPAFEGIEKALTAIGDGSITGTFDRVALRAAASKYQDRVMNGEIEPTRDILLKIETALGIDAYNKWIEEYNNGVTK